MKLLPVFFLPIIVAILLNLINNKEDIGTEVKYILIFIHKMFWVFLLVFFLKFFFDNPSSANNTKEILSNLLYHCSFWTFVISINYFSTRYIEFKSRIKIFLEEISKFLNENFILNLLFVVFIIFLKNNADLRIGIIGSYFFFALTSVHSEYKERKKHKKYELLNIVFQTILNISLVYAFITIEKNLSNLFNDSPLIYEMKDFVAHLVLVFLIIINSFLPQIEKLLKKFFSKIKIYGKMIVHGGVQMSEKELDSSINEYIETKTPKNYAKQLEWDMAIGLQEVDNLKPSKYLEKLLLENVTGEKTIYEVEQELKQYYFEKEKINEVNYDELECDLVSTRIVELLQEDDFELSIDYLKYIHRYLFQDVYEFAGEFRKVDFSKHERILNNDSVAYGDCKLLEQSLDYDISLEKNKNYKEMNIVDVVNNITEFSSRIWQIHPFREGNTRTTALFIEKYLISLGYNVDNKMFKDKSVYYRNALVRSNYFNNYLNIKQDNSFLIKFYENLLLGKNNNLHSRDLIVEELFNKNN